MRTSLPKTRSTTPEPVGAYKSLAQVERAFRSLKTVDLHVRPIFHWTSPTRARPRLPVHARLLRRAAHARQARPDALRRRPTAKPPPSSRNSIVAKAQRSPAAPRKETTGRTDDGLPVHSFQSLLADLATLARNTVVTANAPDRPFTILTRPTPIQQKAFDLLGFPIACTQ